MLTLAVRDHVDRDYVPQLSRLAAADHEPDDLIAFFRDQGSALARLQIILKLEPRVRYVVAKGGVIDFIELLEVGSFVLAYLSCHSERLRL